MHKVRLKTQEVGGGFNVGSVCTAVSPGLVNASGI